MIINARNYPDFKIAVASIRHLDAVLYNNSVTIQGVSHGVIYAFDHQAGIAVVAQIAGYTLSSVTADFPNAIAIADHLQVSESSQLSESF